MEFTGSLVIQRPGVVDRLRESLPDRLARGGFLISTAAPLRATRALGFLQRLRRGIRRAGRAEPGLGMARSMRFELPFGDVGELGYTISVPGLGRALSLLVGAATVGAYLWDGVIPAVFALVLGGGGIAIWLHYAVRRSVIAYLGLLPAHYGQHRLSMG